MNSLTTPFQLSIDGIGIRTDTFGRFCLNDLHKASGSQEKNKPKFFLENKQTQELVQELTEGGIPSSSKIQPVSVIRGGLSQGTYVVKELVYSYAMWISAAFNLKVIRTFDAYINNQIQPVFDITNPVHLLQAIEIQSKKNLELQTKVEELTPTVKAFDRIATADGSICITDAAKALQMRPKDLISKLQAEKWIYKRTGAAHWLGYQDKVQSGYLEHKVTEVTRTDGTSKITEQVRITPKGLTKLATLIGNQP